jgi:hypothetical protein
MWPRPVGKQLQFLPFSVFSMENKQF